MAVAEIMGLRIRCTLYYKCQFQAYVSKKGTVPVVVAVLAPPFYVAGVSEILLGFGSAV